MGTTKTTKISKRNFKRRSSKPYDAGIIVQKVNRLTRKLGPKNRGIKKAKPISSFLDLPPGKNLRLYFVRLNQMSNLLPEVRNMIYDHAIVDANPTSVPIRLTWLPLNKRRPYVSTSRNGYFGISRACRQTRTEFLVKYYRENVFEIKLCDISKFGTLLVKNHLPVPKVLNISFQSKGISPGAGISFGYKDIEILPLLYFKKRFPESDLRFTWPETAGVMHRNVPGQAARVSGLCENVSGEWRDLLNRKVLSQVNIEVDGGVSLIFFFSRAPKWMTKLPWPNGYPPTPSDAYLETLNLQGVSVRCGVFYA